MSSAVFALPSAISPSRRADLPRRAVAALERVMVDERLLQRMQRAVGRETLDRGDLRAIVHDGKRQARIDRRPSMSTVQAPHWP